MRLPTASVLSNPAAGLKVFYSISPSFAPISWYPINPSIGRIRSGQLVDDASVLDHVEIFKSEQKAKGLGKFFDLDHSSTTNNNLVNNGSNSNQNGAGTEHHTTSLFDGDDDDLAVGSVVIHKGIGVGKGKEKGGNGSKYNIVAFTKSTHSNAKMIESDSDLDIIGFEDGLGKVEVGDKGGNGDCGVKMMKQFTSPNKTPNKIKMVHNSTITTPTKPTPIKSPQSAQKRKCSQSIPTHDLESDMGDGDDGDDDLVITQSVFTQTSTTPSATSTSSQHPSQPPQQHHPTHKITKNTPGGVKKSKTNYQPQHSIFNIANKTCGVIDLDNDCIDDGNGDGDEIQFVQLGNKSTPSQSTTTQHKSKGVGGTTKANGKKKMPTTMLSQFISQHNTKSLIDSNGSGNDDDQILEVGFVAGEMK